MNMICVDFYISFIFFQSIGRNIEISTVQSDKKQIKNIFHFNFPQFYDKLSEYRAVGLSSHRTIDKHPSVLGHSGSDVLLLGHLDYYEFKKECQRAAVRADSARFKDLQDPGSLKGVEVEHPGP